MTHEFDQLDQDGVVLVSRLFSPFIPISKLVPVRPEIVGNCGLLLLSPTAAMDVPTVDPDGNS
jgi:hypothetical protein